MEREWREASDMRASVAGLAGVLVVAAGLRFWALGHGLPVTTGIDEPQLMSRVLRMMSTGDFNPHFYDYPGLYLYAQLAVACARFLFGVFNGAWGSLAQVGAIDFYLWGRAVTAILGTATVYLVYLIGSRWGARHALLAAGLMAVMPNHVRESHYILTDVPMTFFTTLSFLLTLRALEKKTLGAFAWAGAVAGLAAATKYYGAVILIAPVTAVLLTRDANRPRTTVVLSVIGAAAAGFLLFAPYTVLDLPGFLNGFASLQMAFRGSTPPEPAWLTYLKHLRLALWMPAMLLLLWGTALAVARVITGPGKDRFALLVLFPVVYFALVGTRTLVFARYLMPLFPFISVLVAIAIVSGVTLLRRFNIGRPVRTALIAGLTIVALLPALVTSFNYNRMISRRMTDQLAYEWILANVPPHTRLLFEGPGLTLPAGRYETSSVDRLIDRGSEPCDAGKVDYMVALEYVFGRYVDAPRVYPTEAAAYQDIFRRMTLVAGFKPSEGTPGQHIRIYRCWRNEIGTHE